MRQKKISEEKSLKIYALETPTLRRQNEKNEGSRENKDNKP
jgi:hypothetical protein